MQRSPGTRRRLRKATHAPRNHALAAAWYRRSAEAGYFRGEYNYATLLMAAGRKTEARQWFARAAGHGTPAVRARVLAILSPL